MSAPLIPTRVVGLLLPVLAWYGATTLFPAEVRHALPPIGSVITDLSNDFRYWELLSFTTFQASILGFALATGFALVAASASLISSHAEALLTPSAVIIKTVPAIAFAPLVAVLIPNPLLGRAAIGAAICFFPLFVGALDGGRATPERIITLARVYGAPVHDQFLQIRAVYMLHGACNAAKIAAPMAVIGAVIGEWLGGNPQGLGIHFRPIVGTADLIHTYTAVILAATVGLALYFTMWVTGRLLDRRLHFRA